MKFLDGKKTYVVAFIMLVHALSGAYLGENINWIELIQSLGLAALRQALPNKS